MIARSIGVRAPSSRHRKSIGSGYGSGNTIDITSGLFSDRCNFLRDGNTKNVTLNVPSNFFSMWSIQESSTNGIITAGTGLNVSFDAIFKQEEETGFGSLPQGVKYYDLVVLAYLRGTTIKRHYRRIMSVVPAIPGSYNVTYTNGGVGYHDFNGTDHPDYKILITGNYNGTNYIGFEDLRSSDPSRPVHIVVDPNGVDFRTTSSWILKMNKDCQNVIFDAVGNSENRWAFVGTMIDSGLQPVIIEPSDPGNGSTVSSSGKNLSVLGLYMDGNEVSSAIYKVWFDATGNATINYDNWAYDGLQMVNCHGDSPVDEVFYIGQVSDGLSGGYAKPKLTNLVFCYNTANNSGGDAFQMGAAIFDSEMHNCKCTNTAYRNDSNHRNMLQSSSGNNNFFIYRNQFGAVTDTVLTHNSMSMFTGRGGGPIEMFSNLFVNLNTSSHVNNFARIDQNAFNDQMSFLCYNNTFVFNRENSFEIWNANLTVTSYFDPLKIVDNCIVNINDPDEVVYVNNPNQSGYTISNYKTNSTSAPGFLDYANGDFSPSSLSSALFLTRTSFTKNHVCSNQDIDGYEFISDVHGCYSGASLHVGSAAESGGGGSPPTTIHIILNVGHTSNPGLASPYVSVLGEPYVDANLNTIVDFGNIGGGIGFRCVNAGDPNAFGELNNSAIGTAGVNTGNNSGVYLDTAMVTYWFTNNRTGRWELYNHTGTPLTGKSFTIRCFGSRSLAGSGTRRAIYAVNGGTPQSLNVWNNSTNYVEFSGITASGGIIYGTVTNTPSDSTFGYLGILEIIEE